MSHEGPRDGPGSVMSVLVVERIEALGHAVSPLSTLLSAGTDLAGQGPAGGEESRWAGMDSQRGLVLGSASERMPLGVGRAGR